MFKERWDSAVKNANTIVLNTSVSFVWSNSSRLFPVNCLWQLWISTLVDLLKVKSTKICLLYPHWFFSLWIGTDFLNVSFNILCSHCFFFNPSAQCQILHPVRDHCSSVQPLHPTYLPQALCRKWPNYRVILIVVRIVLLLDRERTLQGRIRMTHTDFIV